MTISNDELQKWINNIELMGTQTHLLPFLTELQQLREERQNLLALVRPLKDAIANQRLTEVMQGQVEWLPDAVRALKVLEPAYISNFDEYALPMDLPEVE